MTLGSLFAGIGGFELAAHWAGITPIWSNELDSYCCDVLRKNFDHRIIQSDIRNCGKEKEHELEPVDIITGGFPCQPFSNAGKREGTKDDRYLWPEMLRVIEEVRPTWVIGENVAGITSMGQPDSCSHLENEEVGITEEDLVLTKIYENLEERGYRVQGFIVPACAYYAEHRRDRVWIIAYNEEEFNRRYKARKENGQKSELRKSLGSGASTNTTSFSGWQEGKGGLDLERNTLQNQRRKKGSDRFGEVSQCDVTNSNCVGGIQSCEGQPSKQSYKNGQTRRINTNSDGEGLQERNESGSSQKTSSGVKSRRKPVRVEPKKRWWEWEVKPVLCGKNDGVSRRVDRLKSLGNAIDPHIAWQFLKHIKSLYN